MSELIADADWLARILSEHQASVLCRMVFKFIDELRPLPRAIPSQDETALQVRRQLGEFKRVAGKLHTCGNQARFSPEESAALAAMLKIIEPRVDVKHHAWLADMQQKLTALAVATKVVWDVKRRSEALR